MYSEVEIIEKHQKFAEQAFHFANDLVSKKSNGRCYCVSCEVREHGANSAIYEG